MGRIFTLELAGTVDDDQHAVAGARALDTRSEVTGHLPVEGLLGSWDAGCDGAVGGDAVGTGSMAEHEADCDAVGGVILRIPGDGEVFALSDGLWFSLAQQAERGFSGTYA